MMFSLRFIQARSLYLFPLLSEDIKIENYHYNNIVDKLLNSRFTSVTNTGNLKFQFIFDKSEINKIINTDFELYYTRHHYQNKNSQIIKNSKVSNCWKLVSDYYSFYYGVVALTRLFRKGNGYLDTGSAHKLSNLISSITSNLVKINSGNYAFQINTYNSSNYIVDVKFGQQSSHELGWLFMSEIIDELLKLSSSDDTEFLVLKTISNILKQMGAQFMSKIRNDVNYKGKFATSNELANVVYHNYANLDEKEYSSKLIKFSSDITEEQKYSLFSLYGAFITKLLSKMYSEYYDRIDLDKIKVRTLKVLRK